MEYFGGIKTLGTATMEIPRNQCEKIKTLKYTHEISVTSEHTIAFLPTMYYGTVCPGSQFIFPTGRLSRGLDIRLGPGRMLRLGPATLG